MKKEPFVDAELEVERVMERDRPLSRRIPGGNVLAGVNGFVNLDDDHSYVLGGNSCNAFALGSFGSTDDFYLAGCFPDTASPYAPLLTGTVLDSEGNVLFRLVRNQLAFNPGDCSRITGGFLGFEIVDSARRLIIKVETRFDKSGRALTHITGDFYDRSRNLVSWMGGEEGKELFEWEPNMRMIFGMDRRGNMAVASAGNEDAEVALHIISTGGAISRVITGAMTRETLELDGALLRDVMLLECQLHVEKGEFILIGDINLVGCTFFFRGNAARIQEIVAGLANQQAWGEPT